jgi:hypothetical protein
MDLSVDRSVGAPGGLDGKTRSNFNHCALKAACAKFLRCLFKLAGAATVIIKRSAFLMLLLVGCQTTQGNIAQLEIGMTPDQVDRIMGKPDGVVASGPTTLYKYSNRFVPWQGPGAANYSASFEEGRLVAYGLESNNDTAWNNHSTITVIPAIGAQ